MSVIQDVTKSVDTTPLYAVVGVTDLAVEKVRDARVRAIAARTELAAQIAPAKVQGRATDAFTAVKELPSLAINQGVVVGGKVTEGYENLAARGKDLVTRIKNQKATKDLVAQAETTVAQAKGAVTSARNAAAQIERSAKATVTTGRKEAVKAATTIIDSVEAEAKVAQAEVTKSVQRTKTAAKRTATTTKNQTVKARTSAKAATTSVRKTAVASTKATEKAAVKLGD